MNEYRFSANLRACRREMGLSQAQLARKVSVAQNTISEYERGERYPTLDRAYDLANALKIPIERLVGGENQGEYIVEKTKI